MSQKYITMSRNVIDLQGDDDGIEETYKYCSIIDEVLQVRNDPQND